MSRRSSDGFQRPRSLVICNGCLFFFIRLDTEEGVITMVRGGVRELLDFKPYHSEDRIKKNLLIYQSSRLKPWHLRPKRKHLPVIFLRRSPLATIQMCRLFFCTLSTCVLLSVFSRSAYQCLRLHGISIGIFSHKTLWNSTDFNACQWKVYSYIYTHNY